MKGRNRSAFLAWAMCGVIILLLIMDAVVTYTTPGTSKTIPAVLNYLTSSLLYIASAILGALIISYQPRNTIGWLVMSIGAIAFFSPFTQFLPKVGDNLNQVSTVTLLAVWVQSWGWWLLIGPILLIPLLFPTGKLLSPRWRWVVAAILALFLFFLFISTFAMQLNIGETGIVIENPIGFFSEESANQMIPFFIIGLLTTAAFCVAAIFVRYRRAKAVEREQIKWLFYAYAVFLVSYSIGAILNQSDWSGLLSDWSGLLFDITLLGIPLAIGVSILRYRLWDIDILIRRTLQYSAISAVLGLVYFGSVVLLRQVLGGVLGDSSVAIVLSTLLIAALFSPLRRTLQEGIDRRFFRRKYDSAQAVAAFSATTRGNLSLEELNQHLIKIINQTLEPEHASLRMKKGPLSSPGNALRNASRTPDE